MTTTPRADETSVAQRLRSGLTVLRALEAQGGINEADTRQHLIDPMLAPLGYESEHIRREHADRGNQPDYVLYPRRLTEGGPAQVIVEAKPLGADFDRVVSSDRTETPDRQARRYLRDHSAGGPATMGALTDGLRWRLYVKEQDGRVVRSDEIELGRPGAVGEAAEVAFARLRDVLARRSARSAQGAFGERALRALATAVASDDAEQALRALGAVSAPLESLSPATMTGRDRDQAIEDWLEHAHADGMQVTPIEGEQVPMQPERVRVAAVRFRHSSEGIGRQDAARCARIFAARCAAAVVAVLVWQSARDGQATARLAVATGRRVVMTQPFDPALPPPAARRATERVLALLSRREVAPRSLMEALDVVPLQREFYAAIRTWLRSVRRDRDCFAVRTSKDRQHDILLRHLIRLLFVWILKERGGIPSALFERVFPEEHSISDYHEGVLRFLFHRRLNTQAVDRVPHDNTDVDKVFRGAPFLNGSLFAERQDDKQLRIPDRYYWSDDEHEPGLFDILARYHWTVDEQLPGEREQTLDPELLSNLFEQLIADPLIEQQEVSGSTETLKAPDGAYYTPMDVTAEMVADALAAAVRPQAPVSMPDSELIDLFRDPEGGTGIASLSEQARDRLARRLEALRIFDPAVGSGAFLLAALQALRLALAALRPGAPDPTRRIITQQLHGQDISPMAAQIARLRLFVAMQAAERGAGEPGPLPNLEARIVCADTLQTHAVGTYDPFVRGVWRQVGFAAALPHDEIKRALRRLAAIREKWPGDHSEADKEARRDEDQRARAELQDKLDALLGQAFMDAGAARELHALAEYPLLDLDHDEPARIDPRLLFAQDDERWQGFDVVVGNPPYQSFRESGIDEKTRGALKDRGYRTTAAADLYTLFCEAALALARPDGGVVTLVVPLSVAFGRAHEVLRTVFGERCRSVVIRHYDNIPDTIFNAHPLFKGWKNKQRATILTATRGEEKPFLVTDALLRWRVGDRTAALHRRPRLILDDLGSDALNRQWPRIPNALVAQMVLAIKQQKTKIGDASPKSKNRDWVLSLPKTGWYYVSTLPRGIRRAEGESLLPREDEESLLLAMAALNGHVAYAWWRIFGDGWHVKLTDFAKFTIPNAWLAGAGRERALGFARNLLEVIPVSGSGKLNAGQVWPNVDFFWQADLIAELDRFHIESLGLQVEPLRGALHRMRSPDGWDFA